MNAGQWHAMATVAAQREAEDPSLPDGTRVRLRQAYPYEPGMDEEVEVAADGWAEIPAGTEGVIRCRTWDSGRPYLVDLVTGQEAYLERPEFEVLGDGA